jgi:hypothetical protein
MKKYIEPSVRRNIAGDLFLYGTKARACDVIVEFARRIQQLEGDQFAMVGALQSLGADQCDTSGEWLPVAQLVKAGDRCQAVEHFDPGHFAREDDDAETLEQILPEMIRQILHKPACIDKLPRDSQGVILEPFLSAYRQVTRFAQ